MSSGELEIAIAKTAPLAQDLFRFYANDIALLGNHDQYIIAKSASGQAVIRDRVSGREETQSVLNIQCIYFRDSIGLYDLTGVAAVIKRFHQAAFNYPPDIVGLNNNTNIVASIRTTISDLSLSFTKSPKFIYLMMHLTMRTSRDNSVRMFYIARQMKQGSKNG